jgi:hypothetical protein
MTAGPIRTWPSLPKEETLPLPITSTDGGIPPMNITETLSERSYPTSTVTVVLSGTPTVLPGMMFPSVVILAPEL